MEKIVLVGAGNVGYHLGKRLFEKGNQIIQVFSRTSAKASRLAQAVNASSCSQLSNIEKKGTLYILAVSDDAIGQIAKTLSSQLPKKALIVHTSGATPSKILADFFPHYGIFYPLQSFSINRPIDFDQIPICIEAPNKNDFERLTALAKSISLIVSHITDEQRAVLHVAAVFVNNFANYLFSIGYDILEDKNIPFALLQPLIEETVAKIKDFSPKEMQTGPAIRGDETTIKGHLELLKQQPTFQAIYEQLSHGIKEIQK